MWAITMVLICSIFVMFTIRERDIILNNQKEMNRLNSEVLDLTESFNQLKVSMLLQTHAYETWSKEISKLNKQKMRFNKKLRKGKNENFGNNNP